MVPTFQFHSVFLQGYFYNVPQATGNINFIQLAFLLAPPGPNIVLMLSISLLFNKTTGIYYYNVVVFLHFHALHQYYLQITAQHFTVHHVLLQPSVIFTLSFLSDFVFINNRCKGQTGDLCSMTIHPLKLQFMHICSCKECFQVNLRPLLKYDMKRPG